MIFTIFTLLHVLASRMKRANLLASMRLNARTSNRTGRLCLAQRGH